MKHPPEEADARIRASLNKRYIQARRALALSEETEGLLDFWVLHFPPTREEVEEVEEMRTHTRRVLRAYLRKLKLEQCKSKTA